MPNPTRPSGWRAQACVAYTTIPTLGMLGNEATELESALAKLRMPQRIVVLHYSPIRDTVVGEPPEIFAFLGSSRLEEPLNRYAVTAVFHGHAHHGTLEGQTTGGIPVYNVAVPLLHKAFPDRTPFRLVEIPVTPQ